MSHSIPSASCEGLGPQARKSIRAALTKHKVPGAVVAKVTQDGVSAIECFGVSDMATDSRVDTETRFHLYSGTKLFTACAIMSLVERGLLELDANVQELLPEHGLRHPVSVRQIAAHASGLPDTVRAFLALHFLGEDQPSASEALSRYKVSTGHAAGGEARYRNVNFAILGELITRASGQPYPSYVDEHLLTPWASNADFSVAQGLAMATGYVGRFSLMRLLARPLLGQHGAQVLGRPQGRYLSLRPFNLDTLAIGGLVGCARDFAPIVAEFLSDSDGVLRADTRQTMLTQVSSGAAGIASKTGVGIGWKLGEVEAVRFWNHEGGGPGFCTELRIYPGDGVGFVILMNLSHSRRLSWLCHDTCELLRKEHGES